MKFKSTLFLVLIFIGLVLYVYFYEIMGEGKRRFEEAQEKKVLNFKIEDLRSVTIARPDLDMTFRLKGNDWFLESPLYYKAKNSSVNSLVSQIRIAENEGVVSETGENAESFGLAPPQVVIRIVYKNGSRDSIMFGNKNPIGNSMYARKNNTSEIFRTNHLIGDNAMKEFKEYREKKVFDFKTSNVHRIMLTYPGQTIDMEKVGFKHWEIKQPIKYRADLTQVTEFLNSFNDAEVKEYIEDNPKQLGKYGLDKPRLRAEVFLETGQAKKTLYIGNKIPGKKGESYYAKNEVYNSVIAIDSSMAAPIMKSLYDWRNKMVVSFARDSVDKVVLEYDNNRFVCTEDESHDWFFGEDMSVPANKDRIEDILTAVRSIKVLKFLDYKNLSSYDFSQPRMEFQFMTRDGIEIETLAFGKIAKDKIYLLNKTYKRVFLIDADHYYDLMIKKDELIKKEETEK